MTTLAKGKGRAAFGEATGNEGAAAGVYQQPWSAFASLKDIEADRNDCALRVEKYRPLKLEDIVGNSETVDRLKVIARDGNCPHIVLSVSPGPLLPPKKKKKRRGMGKYESI